MRGKKVLKIVCVVVAAGALILSSSLAYAAPKEKGENKGNQGQGQGNQGQGNQGQNQGNQGNQGNRGQGNQDNQSNRGQIRANEVRNSRTTTSTSGVEKRRNTIERNRGQAKLRANRPEKENQGKGNAKWAYHPKDERGQGNMGKPDMRDPYGHDKESGREKWERSRARQMPQNDPPVYEPGDIVALGDPMYTYYARTLIEHYEAEGNMNYAAYLREFYNLVDVDLQNFTSPDTHFNFKLTVPDGIDAEKIIGVNYVELIDIYALGEQLNDSAYNYWLRGVESTRNSAEENPRLGLTAYATTFELYLSNYLISQYPEIAQQIVEGTYQF